MNIGRWIRLVLTASLPVLAVVGPTLTQADEQGLPPFSELYGVVKSNLSGATDDQLNRAAVNGFLAQLQSQVVLVTNAAPASDLAAVPLVSRAVLFDGGYGVIRIGRVAAGLPSEVRKAASQLGGTNQLKGLIVDLRYAIGQDYEIAAATADLFCNKAEEPLLQYGGTTARSTTKTNAIEMPLVVLVNHDTTGAAEALAAALHESQKALLIGSPTAGQARIFREFQLQSGQSVRIASGGVASGNGAQLPDHGLEPDIRIAVQPQEEKGYFEDPYKVFARPFAQAAKPSTNDTVVGPNGARNHRRLNEAELVRMQRDGMDLEFDAPAVTPMQPSGPVVTDPALSRGLDLLKGLALAYKRR
jgi:hypothetical protein